MSKSVSNFLLKRRSVTAKTMLASDVTNEDLDIIISPAIRREFGDVRSIFTPSNSPSFLLAESCHPPPNHLTGNCVDDPSCLLCGIMDDDL